jgi:hypothetical protein
MNRGCDRPWSTRNTKSTADATAWQSSSASRAPIDAAHGGTDSAATHMPNTISADVTRTAAMTMVKTRSRTPMSSAWTESARKPCVTRDVKFIRDVPVSRAKRRVGIVSRGSLAWSTAAA